MIIDIDENHRIASDRCQWIIHERADFKNGKTGEMVENWKSVAFYSRLETTLNALFDLKLRLSGAEGIAEAIQEAKAAAKQLENALKPIISVDLKAMKDRAA